MRSILSSTLVTSLLVLVGCASGGGTVGLSVQAVSDTTDPALDFVDDGGVVYGVQTATLNLRNIEIDLPDGMVCADIAGQLSGPAVCDDSPGSSDKIRIQGPFVIDLVAGTSTPTLDDVRIPAGVYKRIDFRVDPNAADESLGLTADFTHMGTDYLLDLSLAFNEDIRIEDPAGIELTPDTDLMADLVLDTWLAGVDLGACIEANEVDIVGTTVVVTDSSATGACSGIEDTIKTNMKTSGQLDKQ